MTVMVEASVARPTGIRSWLDVAPSVVYIMWRREMLRYRRDRSQLFGGVSRTILWLLILGYGLGAALKEIDGYAYSVYVLPGVVVLNVLYASLQASISLVYDRSIGLLREVMVSPAPVLSVTLGKLFGGATIAVFQGSIPLLVGIGASLIALIRSWFPVDPTEIVSGATILSLERIFPVLFSWDTVLTILLAWIVMFFMGILITAIGVIIASRLKTFEGFGAISNGVIQPLYFLSGSIFPLRGVIGGVGFTQISETLRAMMLREGIHTLSGGWFVELPTWIQILVYANPVSYQLDLLRYIILDFKQLSLTMDYVVTFALPLIAALVAAWAMARMMKASEGRPMRRQRGNAGRGGG